MRAPGTRGAGGSFTGIKHFAVAWLPLHILFANQEPSSYLEGLMFLFSSFFGLWSGKTQFKFLSFPEHWNKRI